jgi:ketosteroid isomerase-like protein
VLVFTVKDGRITELKGYTDAARIRDMTLTLLEA